jgi:hypothetical protein
MNICIIFAVLLWLKEQNFVGASEPTSDKTFSCAVINYSLQQGLITRADKLKPLTHELGILFLTAHVFNESCQDRGLLFLSFLFNFVELRVDILK